MGIYMHVPERQKLHALKQQRLCNSLPLNVMPQQSVNGPSSSWQTMESNTTETRNASAKTFFMVPHFSLYKPNSVLATPVVLDTIKYSILYYQGIYIGPEGVYTSHFFDRKCYCRNNYADVIVVAMVLYTPTTALRASSWREMNCKKW